MSNSTLQKADQNRFKYSINELILDLPRTLTIDRIAGYLSRNGINRRMFDRHRAIKIGEFTKMSADHARIYAKAFKVPLEAIFNEEVIQKPLVELHQDAHQDKVNLEEKFDLE